VRGDPSRAEFERRYLKSELRFIGCGVPALRAVAKAFLRAHTQLDRAGLLALIQALWSEPVHERRLLAVELLTLRAQTLEPADLAIVEWLLREARTWALVDGLAEQVAGTLIARFPELNEVLDRWSADADFWIRRSALLALLQPLRGGDGDFERFGRYADAMLDEKEFFIRKAIGWILREIGKKRPELVLLWLEPCVTRVSGVTLREAVKYLPAERREALVAASRVRLKA